MLGCMGDVMRLRPALLATMAVAVLALGACGTEQADGTGDAGEGATTGAPTASGQNDDASSLPACDGVWRDGGTLPRDYRGCRLDGQDVPVDAIDCSSGQRLVRFDDNFYAVRGGLIREARGGLDSDVEYRRTVESCRG